MKIKALLAVLFVAGLAASLAFAASPKPPKGAKAQASTTTTTTSKRSKCQQVELKGNATGGSLTFAVTKANKRGRNLVGSAATLVVPAGATVKAKACSDSSGGLTLRDLHVKVKAAKQ